MTTVYLEDVQNYLFEKSLTVEEIAAHFKIPKTTLRAKLTSLRNKKVVTVALKDDSIGNALLYTGIKKIVAPPNSRIVRLENRAPLAVGSYQDSRKVTYAVGIGKQ